MRIILISLAAAASALAVASPASAQWAPYPAPQPYGYGQGYGAQGYGNWGNALALQARLDGIQRQIWMLDRRNVLSNREARRLYNQSLAIERRLRLAGRIGLSPWQARDIENRIARLEWRVRGQAMDRNGRWGRRNGYYGDYDYDRRRGRGRGHDRNERDDDDRDDD